MQNIAKSSHLKLSKKQNKDFKNINLKITVFNTKYIKYLAFYLLSYFDIAVVVDLNLLLYLVI